MGLICLSFGYIYHSASHSEGLEFESKSKDWPTEGYRGFPQSFKTSGTLP
jgi:hypothetical protein